MEEINYYKLYKYIIKLVKKVYRNSLKENLFEVEKKELNDIATATDKYMEKHIIEEIKKKYPNHKFIGEEFGEENKTSEYEWLIDPIDGTVNFASGIQMFGTTLALRKNKETVFGVIFDWPNNKIYYSIKGKGAYCGRKKLSVSTRNNLNDSIITICLTSNYDETYTEKVLNIIKKLQPHVRGIRIIVCTVYELLWIATGKSEAMINVKPSIGLSSCAGKLIISEAGGKITNLSNKTRKEKDDLLISNNVLHEEIYKIISKEDE